LINLENKLNDGVDFFRSYELEQHLEPSQEFLYLFIGNINKDNEDYVRTLLNRATEIIIDQDEFVEKYMLEVGSLMVAVMDELSKTNEFSEEEFEKSVEIIERVSHTILKKISKDKNAFFKDLITYYQREFEKLINSEDINEEIEMVLHSMEENSELLQMEPELIDSFEDGQFVILISILLQEIGELLYIVQMQNEEE